MSTKPQSYLRQVRDSHTHDGTEKCPLCEQALPTELTSEALKKKMELQKNKELRLREASIRSELNLQKENEILAVRKEEEANSRTRETKIREEVSKNLNKAHQEKLEGALVKQREAEALLKEKERGYEDRENLAVKKALLDQREALDDESLAKERKIRAEEFQKSERLRTQVEKLQRQLAEKSNSALGEGAEIDLFEALKEEFETDRIQRVKKGQPGADIRHEIIHNGQVCGKIVYDSKNHGSWRNSFVEKLKTDQLADKADHAILTTSVFPAKSSQLKLQNDVILLNPARVVELVKMLRQHIVQIHRLRLSADQKASKMTELYEFILSERYQQLISRSDQIADDLLNLEVAEKSAHDKVWKKRGALIRNCQKVSGDIANEISGIIENGIN